MLGEQTVIPNCTSIPTPNPNPNPIPSHIDPYSQGFDQSSFDPVGAAASQTIPQIINSIAFEHVGVTTSEATNDVLVTTRQPESNLPFQCEICNISCNTKEVLEKHKQGKKHIKNVKKLSCPSANEPSMVPPPVTSEFVVGELENKKYRLLQNGATAEALLCCDICNVICNNQEGFQKHCASKKHSAKSIVRLASTNAVFDATLDSSDGSQKKPDTFRCELCKISCTSNQLLKNHMAGKKHFKKLQDSGQVPNLPVTPIALQATPPTNPMVNPESHESKTVTEVQDSDQLPNLTTALIASQDTTPTEPMVNPESSEGKTVNVHEAKPVCELCGVTCDTDIMFQNHISGRKHRKNLEKSEKLIGPNPAHTTEPVAEPKVIGPLQEEGVIVKSDGNKRKKKKKRGGSDENVETKKQKVLQNGTASNAVQTCNLCNVVCNSPKVFVSHLAGQKHVAMAVKQAEAQAAAAAAVQES